jgi:peptide/nickel transport system substrate-binding protein
MVFLHKLFAAFSRKERTALIVAVAIGAVSLALTTGLWVAATTKAVPAAGGEFTEGVVGQPEYVNPVTAESATDRALVKLVYANLNQVADSIESSADGRTWIVHLKPGLRWQDGENLTSDDVIFTVQAIQDPDAASPLAAEWQGVTVARVSELELSFTLAAPYAFFADNFADLYILPKHLFADVPPGNWHFSQYNLNPIGSGPYRFIAYTRQSDGFINMYRLTAWNGFGGAPALIANFNLQFFPNQETALQNFNNAQVDGLTVAPSDLAALKRPAQIAAWPTVSYYAVFWNQANNSALSDSAVRAALSEAVDRNALVSNALAGYGTADYGPVPPGARYASPLMTTTSLDLASETLANAGWQLDLDGVQQKVIQKATTTLSFTLTVPDIDFLVATAKQLQAAWQALGAQVTIATDTPANIAANQAVNRSYEALLYGNALGPSSDLYAFWDSAERFAPGLNLSFYSNAADDQLMSAIRTISSDASRTAMFATLQSDIATANPALFLYSPDYLYVTAKNLHGLATDTPLSDPSDRFRQVPQWYLNTTRVLK